MEGDEEEDDIDDVENEFNFLGYAVGSSTRWDDGLTGELFHGSYSSSLDGDRQPNPDQIPLLTYGQMVYLILNLECKFVCVQQFRLISMHFL